MCKYLRIRALNRQPELGVSVFYRFHSGFVLQFQHEVWDFNTFTVLAAMAKVNFTITGQCINDTYTSIFTP